MAAVLLPASFTSLSSTGCSWHLSLDEAESSKIGHSQA